MSCERSPLMQRLSVEDPAVLQAPDWQVHLSACAECRRERYALARSLAIFRQFESQPPSGSIAGPDWDRISRAISRERRGRLARLRVPLAAASMVAAVAAGVMLWPVAGTVQRAPRPAKLVTLRPDQSEELRRVLHSTLGHPVPAATKSIAQDLAPSLPVLRITAPAERDVREDEAVSPASDTAVAAENQDPRPEQVASEPVLSEAAPSMFGRTPTERAPAMLFRSLQQRRSRQSGLQILPVFGPAQVDGGSFVRQVMQAPRPIR